MLTVTIDALNAFASARQGFGRTRHWEAGPLPWLGLYGTGQSLYPGLLMRSPELDFDDVSDALYGRRTLVRFRAMRRTLFAVPTALMPAVYQATCRGSLSGSESTLKSYGMTFHDYANVAPAILALCDGRSLSKAALKQAIAAAGLPDQPALLHALDAIVSMLCAEGKLVRTTVRGGAGGWRSDTADYARLDHWLPDLALDAVKPEQGRRVLAEHYFLRFGPATLDDFLWWSGLPRSEGGPAVAALAGLRPVAVSGLEGDYLAHESTLDELAAAEPQGELRLLPIWDAYTMAYRMRERFLAPERVAHVYDDVGDGASVIAVSGRFVGVWDWSAAKRTVTVKIAPFDVQGSGFWAQAAAAAREVAAAVAPGSALELRECAAPLLSRSGRNTGRAPLAGVDGVIRPL